MSGEQIIPPPPVYWSQRGGTVDLSIGLEDAKDLDTKIEKNKIYFSAIGGTEMKKHEVTIDLYGEIVPETSKSFKTGRTVEFVLTKAENGPYWPRLTKEKTKYHWLKINFSKWRDEDDSEYFDDENREDDSNLEDMMKSMGGMAGMGGLPRDGTPDFNDVESDSDDDNDLPPLE